MPRVRPAAGVPALAAVTEIMALPATMHWTPGGHRLSETTPVKVTVTPSPATVTASPTPRENVSPSATVRAAGAVVAVVGAGAWVVRGAVGGAAVGLGVALVEVVAALVDDVDGGGIVEEDDDDGTAATMVDSAGPGPPQAVAEAQNRARLNVEPLQRPILAVPRSVPSTVPRRFRQCRRPAVDHRGDG